MGQDVALVGFDLHNHSVVAVCRRDSQKARVTLESVEFQGLNPIEARWLQAWRTYSRNTGP